ncbi:TRAP transporter small permease [Salibacterium salarium]|uniref:TRAP transporter small permease n=1 Tax=Salibacterium salarium TaxID=284579 RepID=A0A3R9P3M5_9BACI|nr:TRAP transporter small permease [Salibacterium salarium]RSL32117.1 TRAP transporter small permease [Salibacterium salarium]
MIDKTIDMIYNKVLAKIVILIGFVMILTILLQISARSFLPQSFSWTEELARLSFVWFCLLGSVMTLTNKMHLGVEYFYEKFNITLKKMTDCFIFLFIAFFGAILCYYGFLLVLNGWDQLTPVLRIPRSYFYMPMPIIGGLFFIYSLYQLSLSLRKNQSEKVSERR